MTDISAIGPKELNVSWVAPMGTWNSQAKHRGCTLTRRRHLYAYHITHANHRIIKNGGWGGLRQSVALTAWGHYIEYTYTQLPIAHACTTLASALWHWVYLVQVHVVPCSTFSRMYQYRPFSGGGQKWALNREITWKHTCFSVNVYMKAQYLITCMFPCIIPVSAHFWPPPGKGPLRLRLVYLFLSPLSGARRVCRPWSSYPWSASHREGTPLAPRKWLVRSSASRINRPQPVGKEVRPLRYRQLLWKWMERGGPVAALLPCAHWMVSHCHGPSLHEWSSNSEYGWALGPQWNTYSQTFKSCMIGDS